MERIWKVQGMESRTARFLAGLLGKHHQGKQGDTDPVLQQMAAEQDELEHIMRQFFYGKRRLLGLLLGGNGKGHRFLAAGPDDSFRLDRIK